MVISTVIIKTVVALGPIIFLKLGENSVGQYDAILQPPSSQVYLNYTQFVTKYSIDEYNVAPRKNFPSTDVTNDVTSVNNAQFILLDTAREAQIGLGTRWPYQPLKGGECLVSKEV